MASYLEAEVRGGSWFVRIDDIDPPREQPGAAQLILDSLSAHGFIHGENPHYQHQRTAEYHGALSNLTDSGVVYACRCSRREIRERQAQSNATVYPGTCRHRTLPFKHNALRFIAEGHVTIDDPLQGRQHWDLAREVGDFVIRRRDGLYAYQLATVVDDALDQVSHLVRGCDLLDNAPRQIALYRALNEPVPAYLHVPVAVSASGHKLSKQTGARLLDDGAPVYNLLSAWRFLGQSTLPGPITGAARFWSEARLLWDASAIPKTGKRAAPEPFC